MDKVGPKHIVVIGAGLGGLSAAALLASSGYRVTIYERNATPGGKMQELKMDGFRFDTGPSLLTMPGVLEDLFARCGENFNGYLSVSVPIPICRYFYPDGKIFDNYHEPVKALSEIKRIAPNDRQAYSEFMEYSRKLYQKTARAFLFNPLYQWSDLRNLNLLDTLKIDAFKTVSQRVDSYFESEYLRNFFKRFSTYNGSSPYQVPATLNVIPHVEISKGGYYVKGGIYRVAKAVEMLARRKGVVIEYQKGVRKINIKEKRVSGIELENGKIIPCDLIVSNSDTYETILNLIDSSEISISIQKKQKKIEPSCSGFVLLLGVNRKWEQIRHHNVFFSADYENEFQQIFQGKKLPDDPTIYIANTSSSDPSDAPLGCSNLFILVNAPSLSDSQNWKRARMEYPAKIISKLEHSGLDKLSDSIQIHKVFTPADFYNRYRSNKGSIYGTSSNSRMSAFLRPRNKVREIEGLYMVGGSTHPGGGIPLVVLSAMHAVTLIERFEA